MIPLIIHGCSATLHTPRTGTRRVVVMVNTFGFEGAYSVRAWAALGEDLARDGIALLRYDLPDQGDSCDLDPEADAAAAWLKSIDAVVTWARSTFPGLPVGLCGYRLGGLLVAQTAAKLSGIYAVALVAPVTQGRTFVRELKLHTGAATSGTGLRQEGWWLSPATLDTVSGLTVAQSDPSAMPPTLALADTGLKTLEPWLGVTERHRARTQDDLVKLRNEPHLVEVPESSFSHLVRWFSTDVQAADASCAAEGVGGPDAARFGIQTLEVPGGLEQPLRFGAQQQWPGTWCLPANPVEPRRSVLILSTGGNPRSGHSRLSVRLARRLALQGVASLRVDCRGIGEATPVLRTPNHALYRDNDLIDVREALDEMHAKGWPRPMIYGLCSGAYLAYHTALEDTRMSGLILANLYCFRYDRQAVADAEAAEAAKIQRVLIKPVESYFRVIRTASFWKRLLQGQVHTRAVTSQVVATYGRRILLRLQSLLPGWFRVDPRIQFIRERMRQLTGSRLPILLAYGANDPGLNDLNTVFGQGGWMLTRQPNVTLDLIPDADHTFTSEQSSHQVIESIVRFIESSAAGHSERQALNGETSA